MRWMHHGVMAPCRSTRPRAEDDPDAQIEEGMQAPQIGECSVCFGRLRERPDGSMFCPECEGDQ